MSENSYKTYAEAIVKKKAAKVTMQKKVAEIIDLAEEVELGRSTEKLFHAISPAGTDKLDKKLNDPEMYSLLERIARGQVSLPAANSIVTNKNGTLVVGAAGPTLEGKICRLFTGSLAGDLLFTGPLSFFTLRSGRLLYVLSDGGKTFNLNPKSKVYLRVASIKMPPLDLRKWPNPTWLFMYLTGQLPSWNHKSLLAQLEPGIRKMRQVNSSPSMWQRQRDKRARETQIDNSFSYEQ